MLLIEPEPEMVTVSAPLLASSVFSVPAFSSLISSAPPFVVILSTEPEPEIVMVSLLSLPVTSPILPLFSTFRVFCPPPRFRSPTLALDTVTSPEPEPREIFCVSCLTCNFVLPEPAMVTSFWKLPLVFSSVKSTSTLPVLRVRFSTSLTLFVSTILSKAVLSSLFDVPTPPVLLPLVICMARVSVKSLLPMIWVSLFGVPWSAWLISTEPTNTVSALPADSTFASPLFMVIVTLPFISMVLPITFVVPRLISESVMARSFSILEFSLLAVLGPFTLKICALPF